MTARQRHGFIYEADVITRYGMQKCKDYTSPFDATHHGWPVSIKTKKRGGSRVELADYFRQKSITHPWFLFILGIWSTHREHIEEEFIWLIPTAEWTALLMYDYDGELRTDLANITNHSTDDLRWQQIMAKHKQLWGPNRPINLALKRDHKKQKRCQCTISLDKLHTFTRLYPTS